MQQHNRRSAPSALPCDILAASNAAAEPQSSSQLPEVVVTARQRAEKIEDVPATVQAFTAAEIVSAGIQRPQDFIALTPGVSQVQAAEAGDMQVVIRGINTGRDERPTALVVDGAADQSERTQPGVAGIAQIEVVLKGPGRALRQERGRRRDHHDDAQAGRRGGI
jgi:iron complex outermembrane receptor protein